MKAINITTGFWAVLLSVMFSSNASAQIELHKHVVLHNGDTLVYPVDSISHVYYDSIHVCSVPFKDARDNEIYEVVQIGNQCWMAENLRYNASGSWFNNNNPNTRYGRLYDWATIMNGDSSSTLNPSNVQGICPNGWHLPSDAEFTELENAIGGSNIGTRMKSTTGWNSNGNGTNTTEFNALPTGSENATIFVSLGDFANFWSATEFSATRAYLRYFSFSSTDMNNADDEKSFGMGCRCVKD